MITRIAALLFALLACNAASAAQTLRMHLEGIADGDTIYVRDTEQRASYRVRLAMIDAPESSQEYGSQAKNALSQALRGAGVLTLHVHGKDRYGRLIAIVETDTNRNVNLYMVSQGAAWVYRQYATQPSYGQYLPAMLNAERNAKMRQLGLWSSANPVEPWRYRRQH